MTPEALANVNAGERYLMTQEGSTEDVTLRLAASEALHGTNQVVTRLRHAMEAGVPSINDLAYTIRARIKDDWKIIEKVKRKRLTKPAYQIADITDIVGLRIVTLHRLEALDVIPRLLSLIQHNGVDSDAIFLPNAIEEIVIYSTNPKGDAQALPQRLMSLFETFGLGKVAVINQALSNYSSIHMVTRCRGAYQGQYRAIPVEIQIRTAFEDAWSEIDHKLRYKRASQPLTIRETEVVQSSLAHLGVMKTFIDGAAQYADQIKVQQQQLTSRGRLSPSSLRVIEDTSGVINKMDMPAHFRARLTYALDQQHEAMHPDNKWGQKVSVREGCLREAIRSFEEIEASIESDMVAGEERSSLQYYYLPMERALCYFQLGSDGQDKQAYATAVKLYQTVLESFPRRSIVLYRYARALRALGDARPARAKMHEACELLESDANVGRDHWIRSAAPRILGLMDWEEAEAMRSDSQTGKAQHAGEEYLAIYLRAYDRTMKSYTVNAEPDLYSSRFDQIATKGRSANNLLQYALDYIEAGGDGAELEARGFSAERVEEYLRHMQIHSVHSVDVPEVLDTMLRVCRTRNIHHDKVPGIAKHLLKVLEDFQVANRGARSMETEMLQAAREALAPDASGTFTAS
jgi:ppGpp synthetase/RelA/SpoT-type nucleotidyltranferase